MQAQVVRRRCVRPLVEAVVVAANAAGDNLRELPSSATFTFNPPLSGSWTYSMRTTFESNLVAALSPLSPLGRLREETVVAWLDGIADKLAGIAECAG